MKHFDYVIAGAGIIGLTIAFELIKKKPDAKISIIEKENSVGKHASGRNSGVLHTGIYYPPDTLKSKFCKNGSEKMYQFAIENNIDVKRNGKVIVATSEAQKNNLKHLLYNAESNNISAVSLDPEEISKIEPNAFAAFGGIFCKDTAVINSQQTLDVLVKELLKRKITFFMGSEVENIEQTSKTIDLNNTQIGYGHFINATGAYADNIYKLFNTSSKYKLIPFKGIYFKLKKEYSNLVNGSIYPVPDAALPFLGIHFTKNIFDEVYVGPTAIPALGRENYGFFQGLNLVEMISIFGNLSLLYLKDQQNFRNLVHQEMPHLTTFGVINSARKLLNGLQYKCLEKTPKVGIRPQLVNVKEKKLEMDFIIENDENSTHILNSISPAWTSSFAVAEHIVNILD